MRSLLSNNSLLNQIVNRTKDAKAIVPILQDWQNSVTKALLGIAAIASKIRSVVVDISRGQKSVKTMF
jgi:hypothetical protein